MCLRYGSRTPDCNLCLLGILISRGQIMSIDQRQEDPFVVCCHAWWIAINHAACASPLFSFYQYALLTACRGPVERWHSHDEPYSRAIHHEFMVQSAPILRVYVLSWCAFVPEAVGSKGRYETQRIIGHRMYEVSIFPILLRATYEKSNKFIRLSPCCRLPSGIKEIMKIVQFAA